MNRNPDVWNEVVRAKGESILREARIEQELGEGRVPKVRLSLKPVAAVAERFFAYVGSKTNEIREQRAERKTIGARRLRYP